MRDLGLAHAKLLVHPAVSAEVAGEQDGVHLARLEHGRRHALEVAEVLLARPGQVDRVVGDHRRCDRLQPRGQAIGQGGQLEPQCRREVGGDDTGAAAVAHDGEAVAARPVGSETGECRVDQLLGRGHAQDARRAAGRVDRGGVARKRTRVRQRSAGARGAAARSKQHDLLAGGERGLPARAKARPSRKSSQYTAITRLVVVGERLDELGHLDVGLVAERGEAGDAEAVLARQQAQLDRQIAAL